MTVSSNSRPTSQLSLFSSGCGTESSNPFFSYIAALPFWPDSFSVQTGFWIVEQVQPFFSWDFLWSSNFVLPKSVYSVEQVHCLSGIVLFCSFIELGSCELGFAEKGIVHVIPLKIPIPASAQFHCLFCSFPFTDVCKSEVILQLLFWSKSGREEGGGPAPSDSPPPQSPP